MKWYWAFGVTLNLGATACNYSKLKPNEASLGTSAVTLDAEWLAKNMFTVYCSNCHNGGRQPGGFKFETSADLLSASRTGGIKPGSAVDSQIYQAIVSGRMPPGSRKPTPEMVEVLRCWIDAGAAEDSQQCAPKTSANVEPKVEPGSTGENPKQDPKTTSGGDDKGRNDNDDDDIKDPDRDKEPDDDDQGAGNPGGGGGGETTPEGPSFAEVDRQIVQASCIACHGSDFPAGDVNLTTLASIISPATGPALVICGQAAESLLNKVITSDTMPMGSDPLSPALKTLMSDWINGGCKP